MAQKPYAAMQSVLRDQQAAAQAMRDAALSIKNATDMFSVTLGQHMPEETNPNRGPGGPNGGRPIMPERQTFRPSHSTEPSNHGRGITGIRSRVANQLHSTVGHQSGSTFEHAYDDQGNHVGYRETRKDGSTIMRDVNDPTIAGDLASAGRRAGISRIVGGFSGGGLMGAAKAVPYVGAAIGVAEMAHEGFVKFGQERQANAQYQSIYGGTNLQGMGQRMQGEGFKLGQMFSGGLTWAQATEAFQGVSSLGLQGSQRSQDLNFILSTYKSMGMGVSQSLDLITTATKNLNTNLSGLKDSLKNVSDAAKETGQNANSARQNFISNYSAISSAAPGVAAAPISSAISTMQTSMGRGMQGLNFSGALTSLQGQSQLASISGQTISQFRGTELNNPSAALGSMDTLMARAVAPFLTSQVQNAINQAVDKLGGKDAISANPDIVTQQITPTILNMVNSDSLAASLKSLIPGLDIDPVRAVTLMIMQFLGLAGNLQGQYNKNQQSKNQNLSKADQGSSKSSGYSTYGSGSNNYNTKKPNKGVNPVVDDAVSTFKGKNVIVNSAGGQRVVSIDVAARDYTDQVAKGTATLADTGQSITDALGGETETNYQGDNTSSYKASKGQTSGKSGLNSDRGMDPKAYQAMMAGKNAKTAGTVVISPSKELLQLLSFSPSGNVSLANGGAALGAQPQPGG